MTDTKTIPLKERLALIARAARGGLITTSGAATALRISPSKAASTMAALERRGWVGRLRRGVYVVLSLEAEPHRQLAVEDPWVLANLLFAPCYVGGWSAAEHWGLTEQLFRSTFVVTSASVRETHSDVRGVEYRLAKVVKRRLAAATSIWRGSERVAVSDRELTIADALASPAWIGGVRHLADVIRSYRESSDWSADHLLRRLDQVHRGVAYKRLGFLVEAVGIDAPAVVRVCLERRSAGVVALDPAVSRSGRINKRWGLRVNVELRPEG